VDDFIGGGRRDSSVPSIGGYVAPLGCAPYRDEEVKKGKVGSEGGKGKELIRKDGLRASSLLFLQHFLLGKTIEGFEKSFKTN
jgi:hypothetical protein